MAGGVEGGGHMWSATTGTGERRLVTILFCDLVGSTVLSQRLDQEDYADVVLAYQELARGIIVGNGGVVANYSGDGVVGQFGYPHAHENDADRAIVSGLEICDAVSELDRTLGSELGARIECRIGAHASVSVVGTMGTDRSDMSIFGDTANIASRVEGVAGAGQLCATAATLRLLRDDYEIVDRRVVELKGITEPTEVARIARRGVARLADAPGPHVGRNDQLDVLRERWVAAQRGDGSAVVISGEPGLGKTALVRSLVRSLPAPELAVARGRALTQTEPFGLLRQLAEASTGAPGASDRAAAVLALFAQPLETHASAEARWQEFFEAGTELLDALTGRPTMIVVEDLHWADASSRELIEWFVKTIDQRSALLVATSRPGPMLGGAAAIELAPMTDAEIARLVRAHVSEGVPQRLIDGIVARADGVPLFAVELARSAAAGVPDGVSDAVPDSLQASLLGRLSSRPEPARVAQIASVIGDLVDERLLRSVLPPGTDLHDALDQLHEVHVLEPVGTAAWQFEHALLREAVYAAMLRRDRRRLHREVAEALTADGACDDERLSTVGHHLVSGGRSAEGAACYDTAARRTASLGAFSDAIELAELGLAALGDDPEPTAELLGLTMTKGNAMNAAVGYDGPGLYRLWCRAEDIADAIGDRLEQSSGMNGQSVTALFDGDYELAIKRADRILAFADEYHDRVARLRARCSRALPELYAGRVADALADAEAAIELYADGDYDLVTYGFGTDQLAIALTTAATAALFAGDDRVYRFGTAAIVHARSIESPISLAMSLNQAGMIAMLDDDPARALRYVADVRDLCDRYGLPFYRTVSELTRAAALGRQGHPGAHEIAYAALAGAGDTGNLGLSFGFYMVAMCEESCGNTSPAFDLAGGALDIVEQRGERLLEVELLALRARCRPDDSVRSSLAVAVDAARRRGAERSVELGLALL